MDIVWHGDWFYSNKSHAFVDRYITLALEDLGHNIRVCDIYPHDQKAFDSKNEIHRRIYNLSLKKFDSDYNIFKFPMISKANSRAHFNCLLHGDGSFTFSQREANLIANSNINYLWLPTVEQAKIVDKLLNIKVVSPCVDGAIDPNMFNPYIEPYDYEGVYDLPKGIFKFMLACDGTQRTRGRPYGGFRGSDIAIKAFIDEFSINDNVCLIIKAARGVEILDEFIKLVSKEDAPLIVKDYGMNSYEVMPSKWRAVDCMLNPIRDARWEMCCLEALACGTPSIATRVGGPKRYGKYGIFFVDPKLVDGDLCISRGDRPLSRDFWMEPTVEDFRIRMREVYENKNQLCDIGLKASEYIRANWTWHDMAQHVIDFFNGKEPSI